ncbi:hypothetical protein SAMN04487936_106249 [Halobacillus dabanensis]|uniref:Uncharacterized protein n=1 Tax=Halobacillus dabanensis TaxID=240302 RepID=A0A1I3W893_HALDA|nr:hypothetical protein [Halobacillus dabanensis]SFK03705.1 hypothetical protein SAMN04487936_106249 [Halobacillus dabanensis]
MGNKNCGRRIEVPGKLPIKPKKRKKKCKPEQCHEDPKPCTSTCNCNNEAAGPKPAHLTNDCVLVNSLVGSKTVQKVAETTLPISLFEGLVDLEDIVSINVVPNLDAITQNARIIRDKVVNIGLIPATITITIAGIDLPVTLNTTIPFQEHTDFPGACPEDTLQETPLEVEGIFTQPGVPVVDVAGLTLVEGILFKIVLRTTITVTRPVIQDRFGQVCDVNPNRCDTSTTAPSFTLPTPENGGLLGGGGGGGVGV